MADQLQLRRGTTAENLAFTGAQGEVTIDTDKHAVVVHDGVTAGGFPAASEQAINNSTIFFDEDTGGGSTADAYQLTAKDNTLVPNQYNDGQYFGFVTTNTNTGPATADFAGLGQKNIKYADGSDPEAGDIDGRVTMIYDAANDWLELQRKFKAAEVQSRAGVRQTVLTGPVDSDGRADFIIAGTGLQAIASGLSTTPLLVAFGDGFSVDLGAKDIIVQIDSNQVFGGLTDNDVNYLYVDYDVDAETITPGSTIVPPTYAYKKPTSPSSGDYWYPTDHRSRGEYYNGSWNEVLRVYLGQATAASGIITDVVSYAYQGKYRSDVFSVTIASQYSKSHNIGASCKARLLIRETDSDNWGEFGGIIPQSSGASPENRSGCTVGVSALVAKIRTGPSTIIPGGDAYGVNVNGAGLTNGTSSVNTAQAQVVAERDF